mmetsp:Transcript_19287/g.54004  ORF Transcript_19287/g.54004 Transcript_19287/m.54004 type:complete len:139 (+) Transcript_19287:864-1280(+)
MLCHCACWAEQCICVTPRYDLQVPAASITRQPDTDDVMQGVVVGSKLKGLSSVLQNEWYVTLNQSRNRLRRRCAKVLRVAFALGNSFCWREREGQPAAPVAAPFAQAGCQQELAVGKVIPFDTKRALSVAGKRSNAHN